MSDIQANQLIPTFIINRKSRIDRKLSILEEFSTRNEFTVTVVDAIEHEVGVIGLWATMKYIVSELIDDKADFVLICQDDHQFTDSYSYDLLEKSISKAKSMNADILVGGISWFQTCFQSWNNLYWIETFSGLQFLILFRPFFLTFIDCQLDGFNACDYRLSALTDNKLVVFPFISIQKDFGYSDVTKKNNIDNRQATLFARSALAIHTLAGADLKFRNLQPSAQNIVENIDTLSISTYVFTYKNDIRSLENISKQFDDKKEFELSIINLGEDAEKSVWKALQQIALTATQNDEDVIILCEDDHEFTPNYSKHVLFQSIFNAYQSGVDLIAGGVTGDVNHILPKGENLFWIDRFSGAQFVILFRSLFGIINSASFPDYTSLDTILSDLAVNKLACVPAISIQNGLYNHQEHPSCEIKNDHDISQRFERVRANYSKYAYNSNA